MKTLATLLCALFASALSAQPLPFPDPFPLTNTRYGVADSSPQLVSNGRDAFLVWPTPLNVRMTKLVEGERRGGKAILPTASPQPCCSVVWTGSHFLVAAADALSGAISGRLLDRNGEPIVTPFLIHDTAFRPRLAFNGQVAVMLYLKANDPRVHAATLSPDGRILSTQTLTSTIAEGYHPPYEITAAEHGFTVLASLRDGLAVFHLDEQGRNPRRQNIPAVAIQSEHTRRIAIASNGARTLLSWSDQGGTVNAAPLDSEGVLGPTIVLQGPQQGDILTDLTAVWSGTTWVVAYTTRSQSSILRITHLDTLGRRIVATEPDIARATAPNLMTASGRVIVSWRDASRGESTGPVMMSALPLGVTEPEAITYAAAEQTLLATATSASGTLVVWREIIDGRTSVHAGVRMLDGTWSEREIADAASFVRAASNGHEFMVTLTVNGRTTAMVLDDRGRVLSSQPIAINPEAMVWNRNTYVVADTTSGLRVAKLSISAQLSSLTVLRNGPAYTPSLAASGTNLVVAWLTPEPCYILCIATYYPDAIRIGADLQPIDAQSLFEPDQPVSSIVAAWDGEQYVVAMGAYETLAVARIPATGAATSELEELLMRPKAMVVDSVAAFPGSFAVAWSEDGTRDRGVTLLRHGASTVQIFDEDLTAPGAQRIEALPDGRLAHFASLPQYAAPHHGSSRIAMTIADVVQRDVPAPPSIAATLENGRIRLDWNGGAQDVAGYRIEYRIGDGSWNELESWFGEAELTTTLRWTLRRTTYAFRARAFNDAGPGVYSEPVAISFGKRRSVR